MLGAEKDDDVACDDDVSGLMGELHFGNYENVQLAHTTNECVRVVKPQSAAHFHCEFDKLLMGCAFVLVCPFTTSEIGSKTGPVLSSST